MISCQTWKILTKAHVNTPDYKFKKFYLKKKFRQSDINLVESLPLLLVLF